MKMKIISIIISIIGAICLGICISGIINHTVNCKLEGTIEEKEIWTQDYEITNLDSFHNYSNTIEYVYKYSTEERRNNEIVIIVTFILALICIISTLFLKLKSKIIPVIYTIITSIIVYEYNSLGRGAVYISNPAYSMTTRYNALYDTYCINIIIILVIITIVYIIKLIKDYKDYKKENS